MKEERFDVGIEEYHIPFFHDNRQTSLNKEGEYETVNVLAQGSEQRM